MSTSSNSLQDTLQYILRRLEELDRKVDHMNRTLNLLASSNANNAPGYHGNSAVGHMGWGAQGSELFGGSSAYYPVE